MDSRVTFFKISILGWLLRFNVMCTKFGLVMQRLRIREF